MRTQAQHPMIPTPTHDEGARTSFVYHLSNFIRRDVTPHNKGVYDSVVRPAFEAEHGRAPSTRHEVRKAMEPTPPYKMSSALQRCAQEMMWASVGETVGRELPRLVDSFMAIDNAVAKKGSLTLNSELAIPGYAAENHHHCMAGGYHQEHTVNDVFQGALYDRGSFIYVDGNFGPWNDGLGMALAKFIKMKFPEFRPRRILDMGCTVGGSTVCLKQMFPDAEVHGIDVGAPALRYAHARAEFRDVAVHFTHANAEETPFPDSHFDLVCSAAMFHESSHRAVLNVLKETKRLLADGGLMAHAEIQPYRRQDPWIDFTRDWDSHNNMEPFWGPCLDMDLVASAKSQGWSDNQVWHEVGLGPAEAHDIVPEVDANKVMGASRGARGLGYLFGRKSA